MKNLLTAIALLTAPIALSQTPCSGGSAGSFPCDGYDLQDTVTLGQMNASSGNDSWGWTDPLDGKEYAIVAVNNGTAFIDISNPTNVVYLGKLPTHTSSSSWRDVKTYANHAFVVSEAGGHGMQVFDLTRLRNVANPPVTFTEDAHYDGFGSAHNIVINEDTGYAYGVGTSSFNGGPHFVNIQDPLNPTAAGGYGMDDYSHDAQVVTYSGPDSDYTGREILIGSNENEVVIVDITNKSNPVNIASISYTNVGYTHQGWFTEDQRYFILGDETDELGNGFDTRTIVFDFLDLDNPQHHFNHFGETPAIDHNGYVVGDRYYLANYRAGLRVFDISNIAGGSMTEIGYFDSYPNNNNASFSGAWNVYPFFSSGNIVISDINRGFLLVKSSDVDTEDPVALCQNFTAVLDEDGEVTVTGDDVDGGSTDNSGFVTLTVTPNEFDCSDIGAQTVTLTATDPSGNTDTCTATVTIVDSLAPQFVCPGEQTVPYDQGSFYEVPDYVANGDVTASDNCTSPLDIDQVPAPGTQLTEGVYTIEFEATDDEGNTATCSFELTVVELLSNGDVTLAEGLRIFPNPANDVVELLSASENITQVSVSDITGKLLWSTNDLNTNRYVLDITSWSQGIYFVEINEEVTRKIVKK
ncbi:MAG: choice-of-anchor B family protein [Bacteroidota bacterium]